MEQEKYIRRQTVHMALLSGLFWFGWAMTNYWSVYLMDYGFNAGMIGLLNAICSATGASFLPLWGILADKIRSVKKVAVITLGMTCILWSLTPVCHMVFPTAVLPFFIYIPLITCFKNGASPFHENLLVRNSSELNIEYGHFRWIGSLLGSAGSFVIYFVVKAAGYSATWWMFGLCMIPALIFTLTSRDPKDFSTSKKEKLQLGELFRSRAYVIFLLFALVYYITQSFEYIFIPFFLDDIGIGSGSYSIISAVSALIEIPMLLNMDRLRSKFSLRTLIMTVPVLHMTACVLFATVVKTWAGIIVSTVLMGAGNGIFIGSVYLYCLSIAPQNVKASAQAFYATMVSIGAVLGSLFGGYIMDAIGARPFFLLTGVLFLVSTVLLAFSGMKGKKKTAE